MVIKINKKRFKKNCAITEKIFNTSIVINHFCGHFQDIEEISNIVPIAEFLKNEADKLNYDMFNIINGLNEKGEKINYKKDV